MAGISAAADGASGPHRPKTRQRKVTTRGTAQRNDHAASADDPVPPVPPQKTTKREKADLASIPIIPSTPGSSSTTASSFDPKSILPDSKPKKSLSRLLETSSSGNKPAVFQCIDGAVRTTDQSEPVLDKKMLASRFDQYIADSDDPCHSKADEDDQFTAFGIKAYPTRAVLNDICYDFVSLRRWCPNANRCLRIHPIDKFAHRQRIVKEHYQFARMRALTATGSGPSQHQTIDLTVPNIESVLVQDPPPHVRLPNTRHTPSSAVGSEASSCGSRHRSTRSLAAHSSVHDIQNWDIITGLHRSRATSPSDTSSSSGASDQDHHCPSCPCDPRDWEMRADASAWSDGADTVDDTPPVRSRHAEIKRKEKQGTFGVASLLPKPVVPLLAVGAQAHVQPEVIREFGVETLPPKPVVSPPTVEAQVQEKPEIKRHRRPQNAERCPKWLQNQCSLGYDCLFVHEDLEYDDDAPPELPIPTNRAPEMWSTVLHDHIRLQYSSGFAIEDVMTGFESMVVYVGNLPDAITDQPLMRLLRPFGDVVEIRRPLNPISPMVVKAQFAKSAQAYRAFATLHGTMAFGRKLDLRMVLEGKQNGSRIKDTVVRIDWDYPHRTVYMGYASMALAEEAAAKTQHTLYDDEYQTVAGVHIGIPAVGKVTVKFQFLPPNVTQEGMKIFGDHQGMVTERPTYEGCTLQDNMNGIRKLCKQFQATMSDLEFRPAPYRDGRMRGWAYFVTAKDAQAAALNLHGRKPSYIGYNRLSARHIKTISFSLSQIKFQKIAAEVRMLANKIWYEEQNHSLTIINKVTYTTLRLCGDDLRILGHLKSELERILNGEPVMEEGALVWDDFFASNQGALFIADLQRKFAGNTVDVDVNRRTMRLFGFSEYRGMVRKEILLKIAEMRLHKWHSIVLDGRLATALSTGPFEELQARLGADNLTLDCWRRVLHVRGDEEAFTAASDAVTKLRARLPYDPVIKKALQHECPVCFNEASPPVALACGHTFCRGCLKSYLLAAVEQKFFPLTCLGDAAKCTTRIPLSLAKRLLPVDSFNSVVGAAFTAHIRARANEFRFCPTPNCDQLYRTVPATLKGRSGVFVQCPSCLARTCAACHADAHDGLSCAEAGDGTDLFGEWAAKNGVKQCPGCRMGIEKEAGCNHMVCTMCQTHICWVCSKTFPKGDGIYKHMHAVHGDFGLGPIE